MKDDITIKTPEPYTKPLLKWWNNFMSDVLKPSVVHTHITHIPVTQVHGETHVPVYVKVGRIRMKASEKNFLRKGLGLNV